MSKAVRLGSFANLEVRAHRTTLWGAFALWITLLLVGGVGLRYTASDMLAFAFFGLALHFAAETWHQIGHAWAARSTDYPMKGFTFYWVLAASIYPKDEPELPAELHIRRALGGPAANFLLTILLALVMRFVPVVNPLVFSLLVFFFLDNLLVFTIGSLLPLGFTDGSTLLTWWPRRGGR